MLLTITLLITTASFRLVLASLYPVEPIETTIYAAGKPIWVRWIENGTVPLIQNLGPLDIQLFCDDNTYITDLANNISAFSKSRQVTIPPQLVYNGSNFTIRFVTNIPYNIIIYTADFAITTDAGAGTSLPSNLSMSTSASSMESTSFRGPVSLANATARHTMAWLSSDTNTKPTGSPPPFNPGRIGNQAASQQQRNSARRIDVEKLKFKIVFILWPALIGIAMSL